MLRSSRFTQPRKHALHFHHPLFTRQKCRKQPEKEHTSLHRRKIVSFVGLDSKAKTLIFGDNSEKVAHSPHVMKNNAIKSIIQSDAFALACGITVAIAIVTAIMLPLWFAYCQ